MKRVNHHLSESQIKYLDKISKETGLSVAEILRRAVDEYIKKYKHADGVE